MAFNLAGIGRAQPTGARHVLVNGVPIRVDGQQDVTTRSGQFVGPGPHARA
jgi:hypothetical protein